jgi:5-methylthioribose kinase
MSLIKLHENTDENILNIIQNLYENVEKSKPVPEYQHIWTNQISLYQNELQRRYIQRSLESTQEALESSERYNKSAQKAMKISIGAAIVSIFLAGFSIFSSTQWQNQQLPELKAIKANTKVISDLYNNHLIKVESQKPPKKGGK